MRMMMTRKMKQVDSPKLICTKVFISCFLFLISFFFFDFISFFVSFLFLPSYLSLLVRFDSGAVSSLVKYLEVSNAFRALVPCREAVSSSSSSLSSSSSSLSLSMSKSHGKVQEQYLIFIADSTLLVDVEANGSMTLRVNEIPIEIATVYFNKGIPTPTPTYHTTPKINSLPSQSQPQAISFVPCFKYQDSEDVILFASPNIHYLVDTGGQYNQVHTINAHLSSVKILLTN